ncbi:bile acid:sodium symporter [uncultured Methanosphaera sp.]|uniref:arsenic resistance protein n=1 Tax=uncultured Methanosphaera sp. TaxID=262501 RepID=UPI0028046291|nr:bile acid:sodium symporter [uncultured Methanosphaera sp.]
MELLEKSEPVLIFTAIILGLLFSDMPFLSSNSSYLITIFLFLMLYALFLEVPLGDIKKGFSNHKFSYRALIINFLWTPFFGYFIGNIFLNHNIDLLIGFFMLILTPCTDWYLLFTKIAKGNLPLSLSILPANLILQLILLPVYLLLFFSSSNSINIIDLSESILIFIILPFICASITKFILKNRSQLKDKITNTFTSFQTIFLAIAIFGIFNSEGKVLFSNINSIFYVLVPLIIFFIVNFLLVYVVSKKSNFSYEDYASLTLTTLARNSPLALAIATRSFPNNELIIIALVIGPLIELPVLYIVTKILLHIRKTY